MELRPLAGMFITQERWCNTRKQPRWADCMLLCIYRWGKGTASTLVSGAKLGPFFSPSCCFLLVVPDWVFSFMFCTDISASTSISEQSPGCIVTVDVFTAEKNFEGRLRGFQGQKTLKVIFKKTIWWLNLIDNTLIYCSVNLWILPRAETHWKRLWGWEGLEAGGEGDDRGWDGWMISPTPWTWVWVNSGSWLWTGRPGVLRFTGLQGVGHDWATELN